MGLKEKKLKISIYAMIGIAIQIYSSILKNYTIPNLLTNITSVIYLEKLTDIHPYTHTHSWEAPSLRLS